MATDGSPLLLPQNRKLRHLRGVYLRNLSFAPPPRGHTVDDSSLDAASPTGKGKRRASLGGLSHARSSEDLAAAKARGRKGSVLAGGLGATERQKRLEQSIDERLADGFFSIHCEGEEKPIYLSEVVERCSNFNFRFFDLTQHRPDVSRTPSFTLRFWALRQSTWTLLLEDAVDLRALHHLPALEDNHFPANALIFHLTDGAYAAHLPTAHQPRPRRPKASAPSPTSSYHALMKLATLDTSIQDALATQQSLAAQINSLLGGGGRDAPGNAVPQAEDRAQLAQRHVSAEQRALAASQRRRAQLRESLEARRTAIRDGREAQERAARDVAGAQVKLAASREAVASTREQIRGQRRRICSDLSDIFDIRPLTPPEGPPSSSSSTPPPLSFQICGLPLPNTNLDTARGATDENALSAALGHATRLAHALQFYLSTPLPYPLSPFSSRSSVRDDISLLADLDSRYHARGREFPLYLPRGGSTAAHFRFEYAWFLLNKDIEALCAGQGLRVVDVRHTLPNLKYLLYVASAGTEEVPERKRGGVRGLLWAGKGLARERRAGESNGEADGSAGTGGGGGSVSPSVDGEADAGGNGVWKKGLPFAETEVKLTLRTKGLRENIAR